MSMEPFFIGLAAGLLVSIATGLYRIIRGATPADNMLAVLLVGTSGTATVIMVSLGFGMARAVDVALVFALLAAVIGVAFVVCGWPRGYPAREGE